MTNAAFGQLLYTCRCMASSLETFCLGCKSFKLWRIISSGFRKAFCLPEGVIKICEELSFELILPSVAARIFFS